MRAGAISIHDILLYGSMQFEYLLCQWVFVTTEIEIRGVHCQREITSSVALFDQIVVVRCVEALPAVQRDV